MPPAKYSIRFRRLSGDEFQHPIPIMNRRHDLRAIARQFDIYGEYVSAKPHGTGHINDTYCVIFDQAGSTVRYLFQRINHLVFQDPAALMNNISRVTTHLSAKGAHESDHSRRSLRLVRTLDDHPVYRDELGHFWRVYWFIEKARSYDAVETAAQAFEAAKAFGHFQRLLSDLPAPSLHETIPDFHHTPKRFEALLKAIDEDVMNRAALAKAEIEFALKHQAMTSVLLEAHLPLRVTHNDCKFNNVMLDETTGEGICVIDLDTVMSGLALYDFGDMVRTTTSPAMEDERDLEKVAMQLPMFEALVRGYLTSASGFLTQAEIQHLAFSGKLITFEIGLRFLADYLRGDTYFKVHRESHNLDRCRTQFRLVQSIEQQEDEMQRLVNSMH